MIPPGTPLGIVRTRRGQVHVSAAHDGVLAQELLLERDLADAGDPLARPYPEVSA